MYGSRIDDLIGASCALFMVALALALVAGLPYALYMSAESQRDIINQRCGYDYTTRDYFLNGESIAAMCGIEQQQIRLKQDQ